MGPAYLHQLYQRHANDNCITSKGLGGRLLCHVWFALRPCFATLYPHHPFIRHGRTDLAIGAFNSKLDDNFQIMSDDEEERAAIERNMKEVEARIEKDMDPFKAAKQMDTDEVIKLSEIRSYLETTVEMLPKFWHTSN